MDSLGGGGHVYVCLCACVFVCVSVCMSVFVFECWLVCSG